MLNSTITYDVPPLPSYTLVRRPDLIPYIPDKLLLMLLPIAAYWAVSLLFHWIDTKDYFSKYRLHTPAEVLARNHVTRWEVLRDVILQQIVQTVFGLLLGITEPDDMIGQEDYDVAVWARRIRIAQKSIPNLLAVFGVDSVGLANNVATAHPMVAGFLSGGNYSTLTQLVDLPEYRQAIAPAFAGWELLVASGIYYLLIPFFRFAFAIIALDTWEYFLHRGMHMNKWLYTTLHSRHHRLYVPYAYGALYNHPLEGFLLDTVGGGLAFKFAGMTTRQGMWFFTCSTIKTVDDHCGYNFPWDPLQHLTENNAKYHDVHHQSWGIKSNFSQPFFTFWDRILNTTWTGGDVSERYERSRIAAQKKVDAAKNSAPTSSSDSNAVAKFATPQGLEDAQCAPNMEEAATEQEARRVSTRSPRQKAGSDGLKGLRDRVTPNGTGTLHGRSSAILGMDSTR